MSRPISVLPLLILFIIAIVPVSAQVARKKKDFQCIDQQVYSAYDLLKTTRSYGNYEPQHEWSQILSSDDIIRKAVELEGGRQYTILLVAPKEVTATGIEIRDQYGFQLEYVYKVTELDRGQINLFYTPDVDGTYQLFFRMLHSNAVCSYMAVLKGDLDPEFGIDEDEDGNTN